MSEAIDLTRALVALDTVNPTLVPGAPGERPAVELLAERLDARGFEIEIVGPPDRPSLIATHRGRDGGPSLALNGHLDTVGVDGMDEPFSARIDGDRMYGRGTCDMKAGVAAMVVAAERAAEAGHDGDVVLALVADEEHGSLGTAAVLDHLAREAPGRVHRRRADVARRDRRPPRLLRRSRSSSTAARRTRRGRTRASTR